MEAVAQCADGFMAFHAPAAALLNQLLTLTGATIVLTSTHRIHYRTEEWIQLFYNRGIVVHNLEKINSKTRLQDMDSRPGEILEWQAQNQEELFIILDDDPALNDLPPELKLKWIPVKPLIGFEFTAFQQALSLLQQQS